MTAPILLLALLLLVAVLVGACVLWPLLRRPPQGEATADAPTPIPVTTRPTTITGQVGAAAMMTGPSTYARPLKTKHVW
jgi:hypothetical protein